jgi:hypothetical protein
MPKVQNSNCAILVLSCDKYADIWKPFFEFFSKYWPDCPFPVYLGTNSKAFSFKNVKQIFSNKTTNWSEELELILNQIAEEYIILILEDYFICEPVNTKGIKNILNLMEEKKAAYFKIAAFPSKYDSLWPHIPIADLPSIAEIKTNSQYRVCLQTAIWNKNILSRLLKKGESPWDFEIEASKRSDEIENPFWCAVADPSKKEVHGLITYYCTALSAGKWMRGAVALSKKENIEIDTINRPIESKSEELKRKIYISLPINLRKAVDYIKKTVLNK